MKRNNSDRDLETGSQNTACVGGISSFFCPPTSIATAPLSGEAFVQSEFEKLSTVEQDRCFRDLYGLENADLPTPEDDPSAFQRKINEMEIEINAIQSKDAYEGAKALCPVHLEKLKIMFLRADLYDVKKAARRLVKHWTEKVELFGFDLAMRGSIKQSDLNEADMETLACGGFQILSEKDRGGRTVFWARREFIRYRSNENYLRAFWYMIMSQLEYDENLQRTGGVCVAYNVGPYPLTYFDKDLYSKLWKVILKVLPVRIVGYHSCFNDLKLRTLIPVTLLFMGKESRARFRSHVGAHAECLFELMTYGIPLHVVPVSMDGRFDSNPHIHWMERMRETEAQALKESQGMGSSTPTHTSIGWKG